jgi:Proton-conducting membrane transporter/LAGLIDADG endonuclease/NADH-Ubiquinone oxidoreductase (complex I), chain 5 N-terminus
MYLVIIALPLLAATVAGFLGRKIGRTGSHIITCGSLVLTALLALVAFYEVGLCKSPVSIKLTEWIDSELLVVSWGFLYDSLTVSMLLPVLIVSALVHIYSIGYMSEDPHNQRFFAYLSMFTFFMLMLVTGENYLLMFIGWEGVGISSYLLINFWFTRLQANKAAIKALVMNRVGDYGFSIGLWTLIWVFGNLDYSTIFSLAPLIDENLITIISICLLIAAMGKSAQIGLHTWLPDAMEGWFWALLKFHYMREHPETSWSTQGIRLNLRSSHKNENSSLFGKIQEVGRSAGNQTSFKNDGVGSSETTCETLKTIKDYSLNLNPRFKYWFIGFTEGDGSFIINKNGYLEFKITQSSVDAQILFYIKKELGFGSVSVQDKNNKTHHFRVRDRKGILKLIEIFNGNLYTERKMNQFKLWLEAFNKVYSKNIGYINKVNYPTLDNGWLSGFTDAEGCFTVSIIKRSETYNQVQVRYILAQKGELELMNKIADMLGGRTSFLKDYNGYNMTVNLTKLDKVIGYFNKYSLKTKKYIHYFNWLKAYKLVMNKEHFNEKGLEQVRNLRDKINKNRIDII